MKIIPFNNFLYIEAIKDKEKITKTGIILPIRKDDNSKKDDYIIGIVREMGKQVSQDIKDDLEIGDKVMFSFPTSSIRESDNTFFAVSELDLIGKVVDD